MNLLEKQLFEANFRYIGQQLIEWKKAKPENKVLNRLVKCITEMYYYTNSLEARLMATEAMLKKLRSDNLDLRIKLNDENRL